MQNTLLEKIQAFSSIHFSENFPGSTDVLRFNEDGVLATYIRPSVSNIQLIEPIAGFPKFWQPNSYPSMAGSVLSAEPIPSSYALFHNWGAGLMLEDYESETPAMILGTTTLPNGDIIEGTHPFGAVTNKNLSFSKFDSPILKSYMQELRREDTNDDIVFNQQMYKRFYDLYYPLVLIDMLSGVDDCAERLNNLEIKVSFVHQETGEVISRSYDEIWDGSVPGGFKVVEDTVDTIGGAKSSAYILVTDDDEERSFSEYTPIVEVTNKSGTSVDFSDVHINAVDVERAGTLPTIFLGMMAEKFGITVDMYSTDAKRRHDLKTNVVTGTDMKLPDGYHSRKQENHKVYSRVHDTNIPSHFVGPKIQNTKANYSFTMVSDTMSAQGGSAVDTFNAFDYVFDDSIGHNPKWMVAAFTGSPLSPILHNMNNTHFRTASYTRFRNTGNGYIQPGLGDAGDRMWGINGKVNLITLSHAYRDIIQPMNVAPLGDTEGHVNKLLAYESELMGQWTNKLCNQLTGVDIHIS
jgi:hypothetical protein